MKKISIKNMTLSGVLSGIAILFGTFVHIPLGGANISFAILVISLFPIFIPLSLSVISTGVSIVIIDIASGWMFFSWISLIAYSIFTLVHYFSFKVNGLNWTVTLLGMLALLITYFILDLMVMGRAFAVSDLIATSIQLSVSFFFILFLIPMIIKFFSIKSIKWKLFI